MCLGSGQLDLVRTCLTTVAWLSSSIASLPDFRRSAFLPLISPLKGFLENSVRVEHKVLASMSLLNFSRIPGWQVFIYIISYSKIEQSICFYVGLLAIEQCISINTNQVLWLDLQNIACLVLQHLQLQSCPLPRVQMEVIFPSFIYVTKQDIVLYSNWIFGLDRVEFTSYLEL